MKRGSRRLVAAAAPLLLALLGAAPPKVPQLAVPAGVVTVDGAEIYTPTFTIDRRQTLWTEGGGFALEDQCALPTPDEWLAAAAQPGFEMGPAYEFVKTPWTEDCSTSPAEQAALAEAEGAIFMTEHYAVGTPFPGPNGVKRIVAGKGQDGLEGDPTPRAYRCVTRTTPASRRRYVAASGINLRPGRGSGYPIQDGAGIGTPVDELMSADGWSYVTVKLRRNDCDYVARGWVRAELLGDAPPDRGKLLEAGKAALAAKQFAAAVTPLERAYALRRSDAAVRDLLLEAYDGAGLTQEAAKLRREAKKATRRSRRQ
ncbi:MAG: SH3 domain-containing protein [Myxococcales bacterium]